MKICSLWDLVVWAYRDQKAHLQLGPGGARREWRQGYGRSQTDVVCRHMELGTFVDGSRACGRVVIDDDARRVHRAVLAACLEKSEYDLLVRCAEAGEAPSLDVRYTPLRVLPVLRKNGRPSMIYDKNRHAIACEMEIVGMSRQEAVCLFSQKKADYRLFVSILQRVMIELSTCPPKRRKVQGMGVVAEPWRVSKRRAGAFVRPLEVA